MTTKAKLKCFLGVVIPVCLLGAWISGGFDSSRSKVQRRLGMMKLAPLPNSATNVLYHEWVGLFTGETHISFQIGSNDLATFQGNSPLLAECKVETFSSTHQHLPYDSNRILTNSDHKYFIERKNTPAWFDLTITNKGKIFQVWPGDQIIINEDTCTIYIQIVKG